MEILGDKYKIAGLKNGERVPQDVYWDKMYNSKIVMAPIGYGEMAPRDIEASMFGSILVKPDLSYIDTKPLVFEDGETYFAVNYDWSDLEEKLDYILSNYSSLQKRITENMRKKFLEATNKEKFALHLYNIFNKLEGVTTYD